MLTIHDPRIVYQLKRVMRARPGLQIMIQHPQIDHTMRYQCTLSVVSDKLIETTIDQQTSYAHRQYDKHLVIAMANKRDKMELIVQKATECGISQITIMPMQRSVITSSNANKWKRLEAIILEAVEQSRSVQVPVLEWLDTIKNLTIS
jgi:16S rRNA (uracil1498-N3)-methyltransferase